MSSIHNTATRLGEMPRPVMGNDFKCAIVVADWNAQVTDALLHGATEAFSRVGIGPNNLHILHVPGTVELVYGAAKAMKCIEHLDAVIVLGCVIRGETPHFDYVCQIVSQGVARLNAEAHIPVIFGVLTVESLRQALDRAGGQLGNKGSEAAMAAIEMANLREALIPEF